MKYRMTDDFESNKMEIKFKNQSGNSHHGSAEMNPTRNHEVASLTPGLTQWIKDPALP